MKHWFGTDGLNRDLLIGVFMGPYFVTVGLIAVSISTLIGILYGLISGYCGGKVDDYDAITRFVYGNTRIFLILTIQIILSPSILNVMIVIGCTSWMGVARLVR